MPHAHMWVMPQKARTLTTSSAGGCRAGHARPTKSASCKGRGMLPSTAGFQLVENTRNDFNQSPLLMYNHVLPHTNGAAISQQRLELENHLLSAINAQRCHALKPNKHTNSMVMACLPAHQTPPRCRLSQAVCPIKLVSLWLPRFGLLKPNPPS